MTRHCDFMMESRPYGGQLTNFVGIRCGWCKQEEWHPARNGGWAMRIFRAHGWKVGSKDAQHRCPACFGKARFARRVPDNPVISKELGKLLKTAIINTHVREELLGTTVMHASGAAGVHVNIHHPPKEKPMGTPQTTFDPMPPADPPTAPAAAPAPPVAYAKPVRGTPSTPGVTLFPDRRAASSSGGRITGSVDGIEFFTVDVGQGWVWKYAAHTTPEEKAAWRASRKFGPRIMPRSNDSELGPSPTRPTPQEAAQVASVAYATLKEEPQMTTANVTPIRKDAMPTQHDTQVAAAAVQSTLRAEHIDPNRQPTRDQRAVIHDELTKVYDPVDQRYGGTDSDKALGARLDLPWAWVRDIRVAFFGDHDRNSQTEKQKKELDAAIIIAKAATSRLLEMAGEAETIEQRLMATRKLLGE